MSDYIQREANKYYLFAANGLDFYVFGETDDLQADSAAKISFEERFSLIWFCDEMWVFGPVITKEMEREIEFCENLGMKVRYITEKEVTKKIGEKKS